MAGNDIAKVLNIGEMNLMAWNEDSVCLDLEGPFKAASKETAEGTDERGEKSQNDRMSKKGAETKHRIAMEEAKERDQRTRGIEVPEKATENVGKSLLKIRTLFGKTGVWYSCCCPGSTTPSDTQTWGCSSGKGRAKRRRKQWIMSIEWNSPQVRI